MTGILEFMMSSQEHLLRALESVERRLAKLESPCARYLVPEDILSTVCSECGRIMGVHSAGEQLSLFPQ